MLADENGFGSTASDISVVSDTENTNDNNLIIKSKQPQIKLKDIFLSDEEFVMNENLDLKFDTQIQLFKRYKELLIIDGKVVPSTAKIFHKLSELLKKSKKAIYLNVKRNIKVICSETEKKYDKAGLKMVVDEEICSDEQVVLNNEVCSDDIEESLVKDSIKHFQFDVDGMELFSTETRKQKHRKTALQRECAEYGWPQKLFEFLWEKTNLNCSWKFKNSWCTKDGLIKASGYCECGATVFVISDGKTLTADMSNVSNKTHIKKRQIRGAPRKAMADKLKDRSAHSVRNEIINDLIPDNVMTNNEAARNYIKVPNSATLRQIKYENTTNKKLAITNILQWKELQHRHVISDVGISPFYVFYSTPLQKQWYIAESKKRKLSLSIDATGSIIKPPLFSENSENTTKFKHVFLYNIVVKTPKKSVPVFQMLSQRNTTEFIIYWLRSSFKDLKPPSEVICDDSKALLSALIQCFTSCAGTKAYIIACMRSLSTAVPPPEIFVRLDRSHFVKNVIKNITDNDARRQDIYRSVIGFLIQCDNFHMARIIIKDFFTLILNKYDGNDDYNKPLPAEKSKRNLLMLCSSHIMSDDDNTMDDIYAEDKETEDIMKIDSNTEWVKNIIEEVFIVTSPNFHENLYYNPKKEDFYLKLFSTICLWSNVMAPVFQSDTMTATSSDIESNFKTIKSSMLQNKIIRVDRFLEEHIKHVNAEVKSVILEGINANVTAKQKLSKGDILFTSYYRID